MNLLIKYLVLIPVFYLFFPLTVLAETDLRTQYNACFGLEDYEGCLKIINTFIASEPHSFEFRRERAKMLAATNRKADFLAELVAIRAIPDEKAIETIWEIAKHQLVSYEYNEAARALFLAKSDNIVVSHWPTRDLYAKGVVVINNATNEVKSAPTNVPKSKPQAVTQPQKTSTHKKEDSNSSGFSGFNFSEMSFKEAEKSDIHIVDFETLNTMPSMFLGREIKCFAVLEDIAEDNLYFVLTVSNDKGKRNSGISFFVGKGSGLEYDFISKLLRVKGKHIIFCGKVLPGYPNPRPMFVIYEAIAITSYSNY